MGIRVEHNMNPFAQGALAFAGGWGEAKGTAAGYQQQSNLQAEQIQARQQAQVFDTLSNIASQQLAASSRTADINLHHLNAMKMLDANKAAAIDTWSTQTYKMPYEQLIETAHSNGMTVPEFTNQLDAQKKQSAYMAELEAKDLELRYSPEDENVTIPNLIQEMADVEQSGVWAPEEIPIIKAEIQQKMDSIKKHPYPRRTPKPLAQTLDIEAPFDPVLGGRVYKSKNGLGLLKAGETGQAWRAAVQAGVIPTEQGGGDQGWHPPMAAPGTTPADLSVAGYTKPGPVPGTFWEADPKTGKPKLNVELFKINAEMELERFQAEQKQAAEQQKKEQGYRKSALDYLEKLKAEKQEKEPGWDYNEKDVEFYAAKNKRMMEGSGESSATNNSAATPEQIAQLRAIAGGSDPAKAAKARELLAKLGQ